MDREKVIKGLERCKLYNKVNCDKCPYDYNGRGNGKSECTAELAYDALALLKEQDAVEPYITGSGESFETAETWWYACGNCNEALDVNDKYCRHCGKPIDWEGR